MASEDRLVTITAEAVFECAELVAHGLDDQVDFAVVRLDRPAGRQAAPVARELTALPAGTPLTAQGFPLGLPLKLDAGGAVRDGGAAPLTAFVAELDVFAGSSGSGVFDATTRELVGIATAGERDLEHDAEAGCDRVRVCPQRGGGGERIVYAARAIQALCTAVPGADLCRCGDGTCDGAGGETSATCATDCGDACGDGACNGLEASSACPEDCGEPTASPPGDTCEDAIDLAAGDTTQVTEGTTLDLSDDHSASCGGGSADRVSIHGRRAVAHRGDGRRVRHRSLPAGGLRRPGDRARLQRRRRCGRGVVVDQRRRGSRHLLPLRRRIRLPGRPVHLDRDRRAGRLRR